MDKIQKIYDDYADIVTEFTKEVIKERYDNLILAYNSFIDAKKISQNVRTNNIILMHAIMDYFTDISRLKKFHKIEFPNFYKVKSYEISWLLRRKPIQVLDEYEDLAFINEKFVLSYAANFLSGGANSDWYNQLNRQEKDKLDGFLDTLYYYFMFRECDPQSLELAFLAFEAGMIAGKNPVKKPNKEFLREKHADQRLSAVLSDKEKNEQDSESNEDMEIQTP